MRLSVSVLASKSKDLIGLGQFLKTNTWQISQSEWSDMLCHTVLQCAFQWSRYIVDRRSWVAYVRAQKQMLLGQTTLDAIIFVLSLIHHYELRSELHISCDACHHIYILSFTLLFLFIYLYTSLFTLLFSIYIFHLYDTTVDKTDLIIFSI